MKKVFIFIAFAFVALVAGITITEVSARDAKNVSQQDIKNAKQAAQDLLSEAPSNGSFLVKLVVREKRQDEFYLDAYSLFGIKFAVIEVGLDPWTRQSEYSKLHPLNSNPHQP